MNPTPTIGSSRGRCNGFGTRAVWAGSQRAADPTRVAAASTEEDAGRRLWNERRAKARSVTIRTPAARSAHPRPESGRPEPMASPNTIHFTDSNFESEAMQAGQPVLVDF
ncbi:MAG: hypothetical protein ACO3EP_08870, partial [Phycisphaerales bacterium]